CELHLAGPEYNVQQGRSCISEAIAEELFGNELFAKEDCLSGDVLKAKKASITVDNLLSPTHTLLQIHCLDQKGLVYDILKISKDCDIRVSGSYGIPPTPARRALFIVYQSAVPYIAERALRICIFSAEIGRHSTSDRKWEVYRFLLDESRGFPLTNNRAKRDIVDKARRTLMRW
ncbi:ACT domain-containing protein ACR9-like protein, partial [Tanacetum coccineum]